jgi:hypothetical protein
MDPDQGYRMSFSRIPDLGSRIPDLGSRILDPGSWIPDLGSRILDPGSWIPDLGSRILDTGSPIRNPYFCELSNNFLGKKDLHFPVNWLKFFGVDLFNFCGHYGYKKGKTTNFFPSFSAVVRSGIWDPAEIRDLGQEKIRIGDKHPQCATMLYFV